MGIFTICVFEFVWRVNPDAMVRLPPGDPVTGYIASDTTYSFIGMYWEPFSLDHHFYSIWSSFIVGTMEVDHISIADSCCDSQLFRFPLPSHCTHCPNKIFEIVVGWK